MLVNGRCMFFMIETLRWHIINIENVVVFKRTCVTLSWGTRVHAWYKTDICNDIILGTTYIHHKLLLFRVYVSIGLSVSLIGYESFRIQAVKFLLVEMFKIFNGLSPEYLSDIFEISDNPYCMRDKNKLIQPLKHTTTYRLRSFEYYGSHVWNMLWIHFRIQK